MKWIKISDQLPPEDINVFLYLQDMKYESSEKYTSIGCLKIHTWLNNVPQICFKMEYSENCCNGDNITHWMPLPQPPEE